MVDQSELIDQLKRLRQRRGLTPARLAGMDAVMAALGTDSPTVAYDKLVQAVRELGDDPMARSLRAAYGIDFSNFTTLDGRRGAYAATVDRSADAVEGWENQLIVELVTLLLDQPEPIADSREDYTLMFDAFIEADGVKHLRIVRAYESGRRDEQISQPSGHTVEVEAGPRAPVVLQPYLVFYGFHPVDVYVLRFSSAAHLRRGKALEAYELPVREAADGTYTTGGMAIRTFHAGEVYQAVWRSEEQQLGSGG